MTCDRCGGTMTHEGSATTATHETDWYSCGCGRWVKDSREARSTGQDSLF